MAIACPAGPVDMDRIRRGAERLRTAGWIVEIGQACGSRTLLWAGTDEERAADLMGFLEDPRVDAVFAGRGGVGCMRLLPLLDRLRLRSRPCWIVGRSDLTALHLHLWNRFGWIGLSGPMVATDLAAETGADSVWSRTLRLLTDPRPAGPIEASALETWIEGSADGPIIPANLSVIASLAGTPYLPPLAGAILVLEDVNEPLHRIDRMLTQLRLSGALDGIAGLVFGQFTDCVSRQDGQTEQILADLLRDHAEKIAVPAIARFPYGHEAEFQPLPVGARARIETDPPALILVEAAAASREEGVIS